MTSITEHVLDNIDNISFGISADQDTSGSTSDGGYIRRITEDGEIPLRFVDEWPWVSFWEHYDPEIKTSYPCTGNKDTCIGCQKRDNATKEQRENYKEMVSNSHRLLVNALDKEGFVHLWKLPYSMKDTFVKFYEKYGTVRNRIFDVIRTNSGGKTSYNALGEDKEPIDMTALEARTQDPFEALKDMYKEAFDPTRVSERQERQEASKSNTEEKRAAQAEKEIADRNGDDPAPFDQDGEQTFTESQIRDFDKDTLMAFLEDAGIPFSVRDSRADLADMLIESLS